MTLINADCNQSLALILLFYSILKAVYCPQILLVHVQPIQHATICVLLYSILYCIFYILPVNDRQVPGHQNIQSQPLISEPRPVYHMSAHTMFLSLSLSPPQKMKILS